MAPHFARPLLSLQLPPATPPCLCAYHPCADLLAIRLHPQTLHIFLNGHLKDQYQFPSDISHISACSSYDELQKTAAFGVLTVDGIVWRITAPHSSSNSKRQMNDVQPGADQGNPRPKKARTTESQEDYHLESVEKPPVPPKDTIMAVSNPDVIHVTNEDHFVVQNVGLHIIPYTYMSVDGFLTSSTIGDLSFHSWVRYNRGIVLGRRARPSSRGAGDSDRVTCRMVATHSSSVEESSNTISCLTPNLFKALFGDKKPDILITGTKSGAVQFQSIAEGHGRDPELLTTLPEPIHAIYTARALLVPAPRYPLATAFLDPGAAGAAVDDGPKGHNTLLIVGLLGSLAIYASRPGDSAEPSEQCAAYREYHIATAVHASTMVGNMLLLSGQDGRVVAIPFDGDDFTAGLPSVLHPTPLPSLKSVVGLAGGRRSDRDGPNDVAMVVVYAVSKGGSVSAFEIAKSLDVHTTTLPYGTTAAFLQSAIKETLNSIARYSEAQARMARAHETANVALTRTNELVHGLHRMRAVGRQLSSGNEKGPNPLFRCELRPRVAPESMASVISYEYFVRVGVWSKVGIAWGMGWRCILLKGFK
ncbi:hypothetical protein BC937DRAFT_90470 [Endogone sp. FLAS-F59071]|nr:hypothetical protein BC937DRAFT_90470 [Endogone sp. FLAS-F59071]|eukprot:RUS17065.1 hypothetical protein BC937DRAFT_90470 [Endogone sp. FLAS-F59071]